MAWFGDSFGHSQARLGLRTDKDLEDFIKESELRRKIFAFKIRNL